MATLELTANDDYYAVAVTMNNGTTFGEEALSYREGVLTSTDKTAAASTFAVPTGLAGKTLTGTLSLSYRDEYTITFNANGGLVTPTSAVTDGNGKLVELPTPTRNEYSFDGWFSSMNGGISVTANSVFTADTTIYAHWTPTVGLTVYPVTVNGCTGAGDYEAGATVSVTANAAPSGYQFKNWFSDPAVTFANSKSASTSFTMPARPVEVVAIYEPIPPTVTAVTVSPALAQVQQGGSQQFAATVEGANNPANTVTWSVAGNEDGGTAISTGGHLTVAAGETAQTLTVTATSTVDTTKSGAASVTVTAGTPAPIYGITLDRSGTYAFPDADVGYGAPPPLSVAVTNTGNQETGELTVALSGADADAFTLSAAKIENIATGGSAGFTVSPAAGLAAGTYTATVTVSGENGITAGFDVSFTVHPAAAATYALTITAGSGGSITAGASGQYPAGAVIDIAAGANSGYAFGGWTSSNGGAFGNDKSAGTAFTMPGNAVTVTANFTYVGSGSSEDNSSAPTDASLSASMVTFEKNSGGDLTVTLYPGSYTLQAIKNSNATLVRGTDYTVSGNTVTLSRGYLAALGVGTHALTFDMSGGTDPVLTVMVADTTPPKTDNPGAGAENPFTDVKEGDWFFADVMYVFERGLMNGTSETIFSPDANLTRGMLVTILGRLAEVTEVSAVSPFDDVDSAAYYAHYVYWARENGIVTGVGGNKFDPDANITRQDLAIILYRYMQYAKINIPVTAQYIIFADEEQIADYAGEAIQALNKLGIMNGVGGNAIDPLGEATRAQAAAMLHRFLERIETI